jgi:hypothetical protein
MYVHTKIHELTPAIMFLGGSLWWMELRPMDLQNAASSIPCENKKVGLSVYPRIAKHRNRKRKYEHTSLDQLIIDTNFRQEARSGDPSWCVTVL